MTTNTEELKGEILDWYNKRAEASQTERYPFSPESQYNTYVWSSFYESIESFYKPKEVELTSGTAKMVQDVGGGEGDGSERFVVFSVGDQYFQVSGYYASWDGTTWEDIDPMEVFPYEETVVKFR